MNTQQQSSALSQSYVYQVNEKKTKKKFSTIGTFSFWAWVLFLILGNQITLSVGIKASNAILLVFTLISGCLCFFDIKCGDKKYSKGLSIASLCFSVLIIILILVFSI